MMQPTAFMNVYGEREGSAAPHTDTDIRTTHAKGDSQPYRHDGDDELVCCCTMNLSSVDSTDKNVQLTNAFVTAKKEWTTLPS